MHQMILAHKAGEAQCSLMLVALSRLITEIDSVILHDPHPDRLLANIVTLKNSVESDHHHRCDWDLLAMLISVRD